MRRSIITLLCAETLAVKSIYFIAAWVFAENETGILANYGNMSKVVKTSPKIVLRKAVRCVLCVLPIDAAIFIWIFIAGCRSQALDYQLWSNFTKITKLWGIVQYTAVYASAYMKQRKANQNRSVLGLAALILCAASIILLPFATIGPEQNSVGIELMTICPLGCIIYALLFCIVYTMPGKDELKRNIYLQEERIRLQRLNNEKAVQYEQKLDEFKRYYMRELDNIYNMYCNQTDTKDLKQRLDMLEAQAQSSKTRTYCGNHIANCIIHENEQLCMESGIHFSAEMSLAEKAGISNLDLCSIFTNMLNNAVRETVPHGGYVKVASGYKGDYLMISVTNSIADGKYVQKRLRNARGYGLKILQDIARKYNGTFKTSIAGNEFCANLVLMVNNVTDSKDKNTNIYAKASAD